MAPTIRAFALATACAVAILPVSPAAAATLQPTPTISGSWAAFGSSRFDPLAEQADWRCRGWRCGRYRRYHRYHRHDDNIDVGDVLIGAAIVGGIAAIISSSNRRKRERDVVIVRPPEPVRQDVPRYDDRPVAVPPPPPPAAAAPAAVGLDTAVDQCISRIERSTQVERVDQVDRTGSGWQVSGTLIGGSGFACRISNDGAIEAIDYGSGAARASGANDGPYVDGQWSDQRYADARLAQGRASAPGFTAAAPQPLTAGRVPAYPGGPIPGETIPETIDGDL